MPLRINEAAFESCHEHFLAYMEEKANGEPFTNFQHPFLVKDEIAYKWAAYKSGLDSLALDDWKKWRPGDGRTIQAVKNACLLPGVGANWLEHRYGKKKGNSDAALYRVKGHNEIKRLEERLQHLMIAGSNAPDAFSQRFDAFADYLRENHLGCNWPFVSHLAFLLRPSTYFPVKPTPFNNLLLHYGLEDKVAGHVDWKRYLILMELADWLRERLLGYGTANIIEIHSYMWVVAYLGPTTTKKRKRSTRDFDAELKLRQKRAMERERRGLKGERFVFDHEVNRLNRLGKTKLASQVQMVSFNCAEGGFDIRSYDDGGKEIHIEVKTTIYSEANDQGFWLSESERVRADQDASWRLYRVWSIDDKPHHRDLGNVVTSLPDTWRMNACSWFVHAVIQVPKPFISRDSKDSSVRSNQ